MICYTNYNVRKPGEAENTDEKENHGSTAS